MPIIILAYILSKNMKFSNPLIKRIKQGHKIFMLSWTILFISCFVVLFLIIAKEHTEMKRLEIEKISCEKNLRQEIIKSQYDEKLFELGSMGTEIKLAAEKYGGDNYKEKLKGLLLGIANAESTMGKNFYVPYDKNCHNWWGMKGGNAPSRKDGSYLRCLETDKAGADTAAKLLMNRYINKGLTEPETISEVWVGANVSKELKDRWINNVRVYYKN